MNLVWFRNDLRVRDNPALSNAAVYKDIPISAVYLYSPLQAKHYGIGANHHSLVLIQLEALNKGLKKLNIPLIVIDCGRFSHANHLLDRLCRELKVSALFFNVEYPIDERARDHSVVNQLSDKVECHRFVADSIVPPWMTTNNNNEGYKVFSAFAKSHQNILNDMTELSAENVEKRPVENIQIISRWRCSDQALSKKILKSLPKIIPTASKLPNISEESVEKQLTEYCSSKILDYSEKRDYPCLPATSELSSALAVGTISIHRCYTIAKNQQGDAAQAWIRQLVWRDFYRSVMWHYPNVCRGQAFNTVDKQINWSNDENVIQSFKSAETGIPIIDAAVQQLLSTGWMHNRLRMIVASYVTKNLWIDWRIGENFFAKHLFDYDFANNNGGWQWSASVGTDAAPYFRVFNPQNQQQKYDANATFIKYWVPSLKNQKAKHIHQFDQKIFSDYPFPQVDLKTTRKKAIESFKTAKCHKENNIFT